MAKRSWRELPPRTRRLIIAAGVAQVALIGIAHADISRRPAEEIRGPKRLWRLISLVNFIGPLTYFAVGRRRPDELAGR